MTDMKNAIAHTDAERVEQITRDFLQQQHGVYKINVVDIKNGTWLVEAEVHSSSGYSIRKVRVDHKTGKIVSVE